MTITRKQYLNHEADHDAYYGQFVTPRIINLVSQQIGTDKILVSTRESFNDIPLDKWDKIYPFPLIATGKGSKLDEAGDNYSLSTHVCIAKQAARIIKEQKAVTL
jgi:hypothetical protein